MAESEEYFPRGGKKPVALKFSGNFLGAPERKEKKKNKPKKKSEGDDGYLSDEAPKDVDQAIKTCAYGISYKSIKTGVLILGRIQKIHETKLSVMLPCKMIGTVAACHISEPYNKLLEAYVNDQTEKVQELREMFRIGQYVALKVLEVEKSSLMLSMMPQHIYENRTHAALHKGALFQAAVSSAEDHGYVMELGVPGVRAFLAKKDANPEIELEPGMVTWCVVKSASGGEGGGEGGVVALGSTLGALQAAVTHKETALTPGTCVEFLVDTPLDNGIEGRVFGAAGYIQRQHVCSVRGRKPALGQKVRARVLYLMPTSKTPFLTMKGIFDTTYPDLLQEQTLKEGDIVEEAQVLKVLGRSILFKLGSARGAMSVRRLPVDEDLSDQEVLAKSYPVGSTHRVRVLCYNLSDLEYSVSDAPAALAERYFSLGQLAAGDLVPAAVRAVQDGRVSLSVGRVSGLVPRTHLADSGLLVEKTPHASRLAKKYKVGQQVTARVLAVDADAGRLLLTLKPTLLDPALTPLASYEQAKLGETYTGAIKTIRDYVLVCFFNNVTCYVPRPHVSRDAALHLPSAFHLGQLVNCTILKVDVENKKMIGSFTVTSLKTGSKRKRDSESQDEVASKKPKSDEQTDKKKKNKKNGEEQEDVTEEIKTTSKKKDKKKKKQVIEDSEPLEELDSKKNKTQDIEDNEPTDLNGKKKKLQKTKPEVTSQEETDEEVPKQKNKKRKAVEELKVSEESDAIETDIYEDSDQVLTPQDMALIDLSDCSTAKNYKRRLISLLKAVNARTRRIDKIKAKIANIERKGLNAKNKKFHTAMHSEKLVIEERIKTLLEAVKTAQAKLEEFPSEEKVDFKAIREEKKKLKAAKNKPQQDTKEEPKEEKKNTKREKQVKKEHKVKIEDKLKDIQVAESLEPALEVPSAKDFWSTNAEDLASAAREEESSSSEEEDEEQPKKKRKKLSVAEKLAKVREEEERIRALEKRFADSAGQPRSSEQFERALLANPDCSQLWIAYMAFYLQATEIDKARGVARRALAAINFRDEDERLNVWLALLNLENRFGVKESQQKTLEEALQMNEPFKVHSKLLDMLTDTGKQQELATLADLMLRKYRKEPATFTLVGAACFKLGLVDKARQAMQRALAVLDKKEHVSILVQFALLERGGGGGGGRERAEALLEQVLAVYPRRVDVANVYVDMLARSGDVAQIRQVLERLTSQKLPARKMKVLYKKWVEIEEKMGDQENVDKIKQRALEYIEKAKF